MAAEKLKVLSGKDVGTKSWADKMRKNAKEVAQRLETGYMDLAKILYDLYDVPVDGDADKGPWYKEWGYATLGEFTESELNLQRRKAEYLRGIYYRLEIELADMDPQLKKRIVALGWSKVRELIKILTPKNAAKWTELAESSNYPDLCASIQKYRAKLEAAHVAKEKGEKYVAPVPVKVSASKNKDLPTSFDDKKEVLNAVNDQVDIGAPPLPPLPASSAAPPPDTSEPELEPLKKKLVGEEGQTLIPKSFAFYPDQYELVDAALKRAEELSNFPLSKSGGPSHNLSIVCQDFVASNLFGKPDQDQIIRFLAKYEKLLNVRIVIIDEDDDPIYGMSHLEELSKKLGVDL